MKRRDGIEVTPKVIRCAIYTRKSTEEGLDQDFNSLDAQRESAEAFIASQKQEGWVCFPDRYDDGGFTGGNLERPAVTRLLADIDAGKIDCVVVYKVDRLSRSLMDFARMMQTFEKHKVSFVSVTQQFNTTHSMGRLTLNILLSFAQFEREIISERTRDKIAAARRKGKWSGGKPILGYDLLHAPGGTKLVVNKDEAHRVKQIFELYLQHEALIPTVQRLCKRGWTNKRYTKKNGEPIGGLPFDKGTLFNLLTNVAYLGKVRYKDEIHAGEHSAIITQDLFDRVQRTLQRNGRTGGKDVRNKYGALLKGILHCGTCDCSMGHSYTSKGSTHYRYYVCLNAQKKGWESCRSKSIPAAELVTLREFRDQILAGWPKGSTDGEKVQPQCVFADAGYMTDVVYTFCRESGERFRPSVGRGANQQRQQWYNRPTQTGSICRFIGEAYHANWLPAEQVLLVEIDSDHWKSWVHQRLVTPLDQDGAMTLFHATPQEHLSLAKHLTAETKTEEFIAGKGVVTRWERLRRQNHWLDALYNACCAGHGCAVRLVPEPLPPPAPVDHVPRARVPDWIAEASRRW